MPQADPAAPAEAGSGSEPAPVLEVRSVAVRFGGVAALSEVSLSVFPGTVTGLIGPNGAGKTTLFNVISGLQPADHGEVRFRGRSLNGMAPHRRARLGIARTFQRLELFGSLSAVENVQVGVEASVSWLPWRWRTKGAKGVLATTAPATAAPATATATDGSAAAGATTGAGGGPLAISTALLDRVGLGDSGSHRASAMPTGLARMVELGRALSIDPTLLLLDEPGSGLDDGESEALGHLLRQLADGGMAVLLVEHDMELVMRVCDQVHVLDFGEIIASGTPEQIRSDPAVQAAYLGTGT